MWERDGKEAVCAGGSSRDNSWSRCSLIRPLHIHYTVYSILSICIYEYVSFGNIKNLAVKFRLLPHVHLYSMVEKGHFYPATASFERRNLKDCPPPTSEINIGMVVPSLVQ